MSPYSPVTGRRARVLVVDDRLTSREIVKVALGSLEYEVVEAEGGERGLALALSEPFDVIVLDVVMPDIGGVDVLRAIRERYSESERPVIMLTVVEDSREIVEALRLGANDYVAKPIDIPQLIARIHTQLKRKWAEDAVREAHESLEQRIERRTRALQEANDALRREVEERRRVEERLRESETRYRALYDQNPSMFYTLDPEGRIVSVNDFGASQLGHPVPALVGRDIVELYPETDRELGRNRLQSCWEHVEGVHRWETRMLRSDGSSIWVRASAKVVEDQGARQLLMVCEDITEAYNLSQQLSYQASHDALTGLVNRREFETRLGRVIETTRIQGGEHALCYLDLDQFKVVNDTCGHMAGDELLRQLSSLLQSTVRKRDTLARLGGDEFAILMEHCGLEQAQRVANTVRSIVGDFRYRWDDNTFTIGVSIGLVPITASSTTVGEVMRAADTACYVAKDEGRNRIHVYREDDEQLARRHGEMQWVVQLQKALDEGRFLFEYQPIEPCAAEDGRGGQRGALPIDGGLQFELLLRMRDEEGNIVPPGAFLPAAERYNLSTSIDRWVVAAAFDWLAEHRAHLRHVGLCSINLSGRSVGDEQFLRFLDQQLRLRQIAPSKLCFELRESAALSNLAGSTRFVKALKEWGCRIALDDFGSGPASFAYLKSLPVDTLKIDGLFVRDIVDDPLDLAMVSSFHHIGRVTGKRTVAESVESPAILEKIREIGIDFAQGYGVAPPRPLGELLSSS